MKRHLIDSAQDQITEQAVAESATSLVPEMSVLMVTRSGILEHSFPVAVNTVSVALNQDLKAVTPRGGVGALYTSYFLKARAQDILRKCSKDGTTVSSIDTDALRGYEVALAPVAEQERIVSRIDELFSRIDEGERALARVGKLVERYRQSVLKAAVTGELTRDWRVARKAAGEPLESGQALLERILIARREAWEAAELAKLHAKGKPPANDAWKKKYKPPQPPDTTDLPDLPEGWVWASVEQLVSEFGNGLSRKPSSDPTGLPILRISAVRSMLVDGSDVRYYEPEVGEKLDAFTVRRGDLLFTRYNGSRALVGVCGVYRDERQVLHPDKLIKARVVAAGLISPDFIAAACSAGVTMAHIKGCVKTSAGQHGIAGSDIKRAPVPLPPQAEQVCIANFVDAVQLGCAESVASLDAENRRSAALRQSILKAAFSGQLVPQDPNDEPASALLERIAAERASAAPAKARRGRKRAASGSALQSD